MTISVYGVFVQNRCVYIGRTSNVAVRSKAHIGRFSKLFDSTPEIRVLKRVSIEASPEAERSMIDLYKQMGQAQFNSEPIFGHSKLKLPKSESAIKRHEEILSLVRSGKSRNAISAQLGISHTTISHVCRAHGIISLPGRKKGSGSRLNRAQYEEILRLDAENTDHSTIGRTFGVSRERIRQICEGAGRPTRLSRKRQQRDERKATLKAEREARRIQKRLTPSPRTLLFAKLWQEGKTLREISDELNLSRRAMGVRIVKLRQRFAQLFPYRRAEHLRWMGRNMRLKQAA